MILKISGNICSTMVVQIQTFQKFLCNTSRDILRYFSAIASEDPVIPLNRVRLFLSLQHFTQPQATLLEKEKKNASSMAELAKFFISDVNTTVRAPSLPRFHMHDSPKSSSLRLCTSTSIRAPNCLSDQRNASATSRSRKEIQILVTFKSLNRF